MAEIRVNGVQQRPVALPQESLTPERLRIVVQDAHLNFLIGAGTPAAFFGVLGDIENVLTELADITVTDEVRTIVRASIQAYFFDEVLAPNIEVIDRDASTAAVLTSYARFLRTMNRVLLRRHSTILAKQANLFTTNVDMLFEVAFEELGIDYCDGFSGKIRPKFDLGDFSTLRFRMASRFEQRSEVPVFNLVKLHGSAGWLQDASSASDILFDHGLSLVRAAKVALDAARGDLIPISQPSDVDTAALLAQAVQAPTPVAVADFVAAYSRLGIVNPDKRKFATTVLNETYYELIRRLANELEKENSVLFVHGFSFRDEHLRDVVVRAARTNPTLQVIVFCYSRGGLSSYQTLIPEADIKNGNIQFVVPPDPGSDPERKASLDVVTNDYFSAVVTDRSLDSAEPIQLDINLQSGS